MFNPHLLVNSKQLIVKGLPAFTDNFVKFLCKADNWYIIFRCYNEENPTLIPDTIETKFTKTLRHTKLGIASCVIAVLVYLYFLVAGYIGLYGLDALFKDSNELAALGIVIISFFIHLAVCSVGFIIGLVFAIVGLTLKDRKRLFAVVGLVLNLIPLVSAISLAIYFFGILPKK